MEKQPWYKPAFRFVRKVIVFIVGLVYFFIYFACYILNVIARVLLGISYFGMREPRKGSDIFMFMFKRAPWDK